MLEWIKSRLEVILDKLDNIEIEKTEKPKKEKKIDFDPIIERFNQNDVFCRKILEKVIDLERKSVQQYSGQPYGGLQSDINKIMISMVSLPGKIQNTHNKLDEVLFIWKKILETKKK